MRLQREEKDAAARTRRWIAQIERAVGTDRPSPCVGRRAACGDQLQDSGRKTVRLPWNKQGQARPRGTRDPY